MTNDRITELAKQAGMEVHPRKMQIRVGADTALGLDSTEVIKRFAELVRNDVLKDVAAACKSWGSPSSKTYLGTACMAAASRITGMKS